MVKTMREQELFDTWKKLGKRKMISMDELDTLMYQTDKVLMSFREAIESRDKWKAKYNQLKKEKMQNVK